MASSVKLHITSAEQIPPLCRLFLRQEYAEIDQKVG
jgi:hypothetical protein